MSNRSLTAEQGRQAFVDTISNSPRRKKSLCKRELSENYAREYFASQNPKNVKYETSLDDLPFDITNETSNSGIHEYNRNTTNKRPFTEREDRIIREEINRQKRQKDFVKIDYHKVAAAVGTRSNTQCWQRWNKTLNAPHKKGTWSQDEDRELVELVKDTPKPVWKKVAERISTRRNAKQCRERWQHHLDPSINKGPFTPEEDNKLLELAELHKKSWAKIARGMPNRTEGQVKTRYKKIVGEGVRPPAPQPTRRIVQNRSTKPTWNDTSNLEIPLQQGLDDIQTTLSQPVQPVKASGPRVPLEASLSSLFIGVIDNPQEAGNLAKDALAPLDAYPQDPAPIQHQQTTQAIPVSSQDINPTMTPSFTAPPLNRQISLGSYGYLLATETMPDLLDSPRIAPSNNPHKSAPTRAGSSWLEGLQLFDNPPPLQNLSDTLNGNNWNTFFGSQYFQQNQSQM